MTDKKDETKATLAAAALPILQNFIHKYVGKVCDVKAIDAMLRNLDPLTIAAAGGIPSLVGVAVERLPLEMFGGNVMADLIKDSAIEAARAVAAKIQEKGGVQNLTPTEYKDALDKGAAVAAAKKYVLIGTQLHAVTCVNARFVQRQPRLGKDQPQQPSGNIELTLAEAAEMENIQVASCCAKGVQVELKKQTETPKAAPLPPPRSPMEVMMRGTEEQRKAFFTAYEALDADTQQRVDGLMKHLDSLEEFAGLIYVITLHPTRVGQMLALMENANGSHTTMKLLKLFGQAVERGSDHVLQVLKQALDATCVKYHEADASLAPVVQRLEANAAAGPNRRLTLAALLEVAPQKSRKRGIGGFLKALTRVF